MASDDGVRVRVNAEVANLTRANLLGHIAREILSVFDPGEWVLNTVLKGIRESLLQQVELILYDGSQNVVGYLCIEIDWSKYSIQLEAGARNTFDIDPNQPVIRQVSPLLAKATAYITEVRTLLGVRSARAIYTFRPGMADKARRRLGTSPLSKDILEDRKTAQAGHRMHVRDSTFDEFSVEFRYQNPDSSKDETAGT